MMKRILVALGAALVLAGPTLAQAPPNGRPEPPPDLTTGPAVPIITTVNDQGTAPGQFWATADYLIAWMRGDNIPALVTTSPAGTDRAVAGTIGPSTTSVLFGG